MKACACILVLCLCVYLYAQMYVNTDRGTFPKFYSAEILSHAVDNKNDQIFASICIQPFV